MKRVMYRPVRNLVLVEVEKVNEVKVDGSGILIARSMSAACGDQKAGELDHYREDVGVIKDYGPLIGDDLGYDVPEQYKIKIGDKVKFKTYGGMTLHQRSLMGLSLEEYPSMRMIQASDIIAKIEETEDE